MYTLDGHLETLGFGSVKGYLWFFMVLETSQMSMSNIEMSIV